MGGVAGRSGGRNRKASSNAIGDGSPVAPRNLSPRATALFGWILDKIGADDPGSPWHRIDGCVLASLAETLESQERISSMLADNPGDLQLHRLRNNLTTQISRLSALVGMTPVDRQRQPQAEPEADDEDVLVSIMTRMASTK